MSRAEAGKEPTEADYWKFESSLQMADSATFEADLGLSDDDDHAGKPVDPILAAEGRSLDLASLLKFDWARFLGRSGSWSHYVSENLTELLRECVRRRALDESESYEMTADDLVGMIRQRDWEPLDNMFIGQFRHFGDPERATSDRSPDRDAQFVDRLISRGQATLRWDVVDILAEAARTRSEVASQAEEIGTRHLAVALLRSRGGQAALARANLLDGGLGAIGAWMADLLMDSNFAPLGDSDKRWGAVASTLRDLPPLVSLDVETRPSYLADRAERLVVDSLGVKEDARALSNLILLEAARPPLAIGLFGAWGSGKSTLIKELQCRIQEDLNAERARRVDRQLDDPDTRRIANAVQIEFNAWAYADSENLWASLTSEIFDQLAVGGITPSDEHTVAARNFSALVRDVKARTSRNANSLRERTNELADLERQIEMAEAKREDAVATRRSALVTAAGATVKELLTPEKPRGPSKVIVGFTDTENPKDKDALETVRDALSAGGNLEQRIKAYADSSSAIGVSAMLATDFLWARRKAAIAVCSLLVAAGIVLLIRPAVLFGLSDGLARAEAWIRGAGVVSLVVGIGTALLAFAPVIRVSALLWIGFRKRKDEARKSESEAVTQLRDLRAQHARTEEERREAELWNERFGDGEGVGASSPELMLEYLMSDSADLGALRQQLGVIAKVRRCFEQLDAVIRRMPPSPGEAGSVERIILYIDDLDRCDAGLVSQVLQAVHLLLSFECFVVVVAVDARWLKQSLESAHSQLRGDGASESDGEEPLATAADYLEKIFQIPMWVRPLVDRDGSPSERYAGYERLVEGMARPSREDRPHEATPSPAPSSSRGAGAADFIWTGPVRPQETDAPRKRGMKLTDDEVEFMKRLGPLAAKSPRSVKRMINVYRLIRVRYSGADLQRFLGGGGPGIPGYRELLFALACEIGLRSDSRRGLRESFLTTPDALQAWDPETIRSLLTTAEFETLRELMPAVGYMSCRGLFAAYEEVTRYSFLP